MLYVLYSFIWWFFLSSCIVSAGYHRYFTHRAFKAPIWYEYLVLLLGPLSGSGPLVGWAGVHRMHHNHSDTEDDPHSPMHKGFWKVITSSFQVPPIRRTHIKDLLRNKRVVWFYRHHTEIRVITLLLGFILLPFLWFCILILSPIVYGYIGFGLLNALCHKNGEPRNSFIVNILTGGEGYHKNHHENPRAWHIGAIDPSSWFIRLIKK